MLVTTKHIMDLIGLGFSDVEIAARLCWSEQEVAKAIEGALAELGLSSRLELILFLYSSKAQMVRRPQYGR